MNGCTEFVKKVEEEKGDGCEDVGIERDEDEGVDEEGEEEESPSPLKAPRVRCKKAMVYDGEKWIFNLVPIEKVKEKEPDP